MSRRHCVSTIYGIRSRAAHCRVIIKAAWTVDVDSIQVDLVVSHESLYAVAIIDGVGAHAITVKVVAEVLGLCDKGAASERSTNCLIDTVIPEAAIGMIASIASAHSVVAGHPIDSQIGISIAVRAGKRQYARFGERRSFRVDVFFNFGRRAESVLPA
jgi:hypothetical protein